MKLLHDIQSLELVNIYKQDIILNRILKIGVQLATDSEIFFTKAPRVGRGCF